MYTGRQQALRQSFPPGTDALIVFKPENIFYLSGFAGTTSILVIQKDATSLIVDSRYLERAGEEAIGVTVVSARTVWQGLKDLIKDTKIKTALYEPGGITVEAFEKFNDSLAKDKVKVKLVEAAQPVEAARIVKDEFELSLIEEAARITGEAYGHIADRIRAGMTELEVAAELYCFMFHNGIEKPAFDIIVASGPRTAMPHAAASHRALEKGDLLIIDMGVVYEGYFSDMTRTFVIGAASEEQKQVFEAVKEAQILAIDALKPGVTAAAVDKVSRDKLTELGYGDAFVHGLGHGVGLEVHERPSLAPGRETPLTPNMVFTIEPGVYLPGWGGVRIEDLIVMGETVPKVMTSYPKTLLEL